MMKLLFWTAFLASHVLYSVGALEEYVEGKLSRKVVKLSRKDFKTALKDPANPIMFIMFGAYWCGHCKKLGPVLDTAAPQVSGRMMIGKVDCTEEKKLCDKYKVRGYPTLKFSVHGEVFDYSLGRTEEDIVGFADRLSRPTVKLLENFEQAVQHAQEETFDHGVSFLCHDPKATLGTSPATAWDQMLESSPLLQVCSQTAHKQMAYAHFTALKPDADVSSITGKPPPKAAEGEAAPITAPGFVCRLENHVPNRCFMDNEATIDTDTLLDFVKVNNLATVTTLGPHNFHRIGRSGRPLVIGVADINEEEQVDKIKADLFNFGVKGPSALTTKYYLGWMDGVKWAKFLEQFEIKQDNLPQVFVLDVPKRKYWYDENYQEKSIRAFLEAVEEGDVATKESGGLRGAGFFGRIFSSIFSWWTLFLLIGLGAIGFVLVAPDGKPPFGGNKASGSGSSQPVDTLLGKKNT